MTDTQAVTSNKFDVNTLADEQPVLRIRKINESEVTSRLSTLALAWLTEEVTIVKNSNDFLNSVYNKWQMTGRVTPGQIKGVTNYATMKLRPNKWSNNKGEVLKVPNLPTYDLRLLATGTYKHPSGTVLRISKSRKDGTLWANLDSGATVAGTRLDGTSFYTKFGAQDAQSQKVLSDIAADPTGALVAYGKATNNCGLCGRPLKDEVSVRFSIGPVCLKRYVGDLNYRTLKRSYLVFDSKDVARMRANWINTPQVTLDNMSKGYTSPNSQGHNPFMTNHDGVRIPDDVLAAQSRRRAAKNRYDEMMARRKVRKEIEAQEAEHRRQLESLALPRDNNGRLIIRPAQRVAATPHLSRNAKENING